MSLNPNASKKSSPSWALELEPIARDPRLKDVQHTLTLVDGTLLKGLPLLVRRHGGLAGSQTPGQGPPAHAI